jgi:hypothetical protein
MTPAVRMGSESQNKPLLKLESLFLEGAEIQNQFCTAKSNSMILKAYAPERESIFELDDGRSRPQRQPRGALTAALIVSMYHGLLVRKMALDGPTCQHGQDDLPTVGTVDDLIGNTITLEPSEHIERWRVLQRC